MVSNGVPLAAFGTNPIVSNICRGIFLPVKFPV